MSSFVAKHGLFNPVGKDFYLWFDKWVSWDAEGNVLPFSRIVLTVKHR